MENDSFTLALVADSYLPLLGLACLGGLLKTLSQQGWSQAGPALGLLLAGPGVAFGLGALDQLMGLWPAMALDYSTHMALALVLTLYLVRGASRPWRGFWLVLLPLLLIGYGLLMLLLDYHSLADMLTTVVPVASLYGLLIYRGGRYSNAR